MLMMMYLYSKTNILIYYRGYFSLKRFYQHRWKDKNHSEQVSSLIHWRDQDAFRSILVPSEQVHEPFSDVSKCLLNMLMNAYMMGLSAF